MKKLASVMFTIALTVFAFAPSGNAQCCGDCNYSGVVTIDNLITAVNNGLDGCPPGSNNINLPNSTADMFLALGSSSGDNNTAIGLGAGGMLTTGNDNIYVSNVGEVEESNTIRIGSGEIQTDTFIAGISGATSAGGVPVLVNGEGQLGTMTSSRRFKQDVRDMGEASSALARLRPVTFRYKSEYDDGTGLRQYGLVAEEVAEVYPELVQYSKTEEPLAVRYHLVNAMLLNEVQKQQRTIEQQQEAIADLTTRLARLETRHPQIRQ